MRDQRSDSHGELLILGPAGHHCLTALTTRPHESGYSARVRVAQVGQFGVMFLPDKVVGYREALRVLRAGGRYLFNVWDPLEHNEVADIVTRALAALFPNDPPRFFARTPYGYNDAAEIRRELVRAGFSGIEIETVDTVAHAPSAADAARGICQGTPLRGEIEARAAGLEEITALATDALITRFGSGAFDSRMRAQVVTASRV